MSTETNNPSIEIDQIEESQVTMIRTSEDLEIIKKAINKLIEDLSAIRSADREG